MVSGAGLVEITYAKLAVAVSTRKSSLLSTVKLSFSNRKTRYKPVVAIP